MQSDINHDGRNRRVTDIPGYELLDSAKQAIRIAELGGKHDLLAQRVQTGMENATNMMASIQQDIRTLSGRLGDVGQMQHAHDSNRDAIRALSDSVKEMEQNLKRLFDSFVENNNARWSNYEHNRDMWRQQHEADNENDKRDVEKEIRNVRETMIRAVGWGGGAGVLVTVVIGGFLFWLNQKFEDTAVATARAQRVAEQSTQMIERQKDKTHEIELYLARGGASPGAPYPPTKESQ